MNKTMDDVKNLRIGNYGREHGTNNLIRVESLSDDQQINFAGRFDSPWHSEPIPLTSRVLMAAGLIETGVGQWDTSEIDDDTMHLVLDSVDGQMMVRISECSEMTDDEQMDICLESIQYLHELQNLFFTLYQREIEIDETELQNVI